MNACRGYLQTWASEGGGQASLDFEIFYFPINVFAEKRFSLSVDLVKRNFTTVAPSEKNF